MAAFSILLGSSNVLVGFRGTSSSLDHHKISTCRFVTPVTTARMRRLKGIEAASRESTITPAAPLNLAPLYRDQSAIAAAAAAVLEYRWMKEEQEKDRKERGSVTAENMDNWIKESIGEIVRNIGEAPFLVQIFAKGRSVLRLEREEASAESWPLIKKKWNQTSCVPDGIILVEQLKTTEGDEDAANDTKAADDSESQTWGLVIQGQGMECAAPCYILNTCRVRSAGGFCTHFCLVRAKCFGETLDKQLTKAWLQGR